MRSSPRTVAIAIVTALALVAVVVVGVVLWQSTTVPSGLELAKLDPNRLFSADDLRRAEEYETFTRWTFLASLVVQLVVLAIYARHGARFMRESAAGPIGTGFLLGMLGLGIAWFAHVPFALADFFWASDHGVATGSWVEFLFGDWAMLAGQFAFVCFALLVAMGFARLLPRMWWLPATAVFAGLALLFAFISPLLVPGLRTPTDPQLRADAAVVAAREGESDIPLKIEEVQEETSAPNAFAMGIGSTRRVVLWDTIVDFPRPAVRAVIAHEYGHHAHDHIPKGVAWSVLILLPTTLLVALVTRRRGGLARPEAVPLALLVVALAGLVTTPLQSAVSRHFEAEADWAALEATREPAAMRVLFQRFNADGLDDPDPPGWFHTLFGSHPTGVQRIAMAEAWAARHQR